MDISNYNVLLGNYMNQTNLYQTSISGFLNNAYLSNTILTNFLNVYLLNRITISGDLSLSSYIYNHNLLDLS